jgi:5-methylcytosine-specific restriction endonuclease McrA
MSMARYLLAICIDSEFYREHQAAGHSEDELLKQLKGDIEDQVAEYDLPLLLARGCKKGKPVTNKIPLKDILVKHSTYRRRHLKNRILENSLLEYKCAICGLGPEWEGKELVLDIDHINGAKDDNRLENLRFLCPNCHSQTATFSGKNAKIGKRGTT